jgi:hypothetical protein
MGADPIRPRAARHAVMAAYYQIAGAAERSLSPALIGGPAGRRVDGAGPRRQKPILKKGKPSGQPEPPSSSLGSALAIFSVPGPTWPRPDGGAFFVRRNRCVTRNRIGAAAVHERVSLRPIGVGLHDDGIKLRVAHLRYMTRSFVASADWTTPGRKPI